MENEIKYEGYLNIGDAQLPCYVLTNGMRVLSERKMQETLRIVDGNLSGTKMPQFLSNNKLKPFIYNDEDPAHFEPIVCYKGKQRINGYEATVLTDICEAVLAARRAGVKLSERQEIVANQCEIILSAFARVGIIALIDEATGYQHEREKDELQRILKAYISEELLPWQKRFPDIYYKELFRLNGWNYTIKDIRKRPGVIGRWTNDLIYKQLPPGVLEELKKKTPKNSKGNMSAKLHQSLTEDVGHVALNDQIKQVVTLFGATDNMKEMWRLFNKLKMRRNGQLELPFEFDENGHTIVTEENITESDPKSDFNNRLTQALNYNPHKDKRNKNEDEE